MVQRAALRRTAAFAVLYLAATYLGRLTIMDGASLSLVWPAAGIGVVWLLAQREAATRLPDLAALAVITFAVNLATGASPALAAAFVVANLAQVTTFLALLRRSCPELWGAGGHEQLRHVSQLWRLVVAAAAATAAGAAIGPTAVLVLTGHWSWATTAVWMTRNTVSVLIIGAVGIRFGALLAARAPGSSALRALVDAVTAHSRCGRWRAAEVVAVVVCSVVGYWLVFGVADGMPLAFVLVVITLWAGVRLPVTFVVCHDLLAGTAAVLFTLHGDGPFSAIESSATRALVVQAFVGMTALVGLALALSREERDALLEEVRRGKDAAAAHAELLTTIVESMDEGLGVVDRDGRFLLRNAASRRLVGGQVSTTGVVQDASFYGLHHPDGTPLEPDESPIPRALAGEDVREMDVLLRNDGVPNGRVLAISAVPLPEPTGGAVIVFRDVTAERAHQQELASFAGVVAHDLLNPLTVIDGWLQVLDDELTASAEAGQARAAGEGSGARDALARIARAAVRMRQFIGNLLDYTTAGEAAFTPEDLELRDVVSDVADARTDLPPDAGACRPVVTVGDLPPVHADPALLRQLFDNLIGNAIKYTEPGAAPQVAVTAVSMQPGWLRVDVADRGIGIPAGQHEAVFGDFHRAHRTSGYSGSGLGLAICRRIVQRHGGTIRAEDNPGGGTRVVLTLPLARAAAGRPPSAAPVLASARG